MAPTIPTTEPTTFVAGDTVKWNLPDDSDYPIADGWALTYAIRAVSGTATLDLGAAEITQATTQHQVVIPAASTAPLSAGRYRWAGYMTLSGERYQTRSGEFDVERDFATAEGALSHAAKTLAAIEAVIEGRATADVESFQINGRALNKTPLKDLLNMRGVYAAMVQREQNNGSPMRSHEVSFVAAR